jgi:uncharacterized protein
MSALQKKVLIGGASGMIGAALVRAADAKRIHPFRLIRKKPTDGSEIQWNPSEEHPVQSPAQLEGMDAVIHLSGANLSAQRWTEAYKREIFDSRIATTRALVKLLKELKQPPRTLLCASATGIYGDRGDEVLTEDSTSGQGFLADVCRQWEAEADRAVEAGIRVVYLRFGVVLASQGGALRRMLPLFRAGLGGKLGSGEQWMNWMTLNDTVRAVFHLLELEAVEGPVNFAAPNPVTNAELTRALGRVLHRPAVLSAPAFALRLTFGEIADEALLASTRAVPDRLLRSGFNFEQPEIEGALKSILGRS